LEAGGADGHATQRKYIKAAILAEIISCRNIQSVCFFKKKLFLIKQVSARSDPQNVDLQEIERTKKPITHLFVQVVDNALKRTPVNFQVDRQKNEGRDRFASSTKFTHYHDDFGSVL
jgi:hypothetical protein